MQHQFLLPTTTDSNAGHGNQASVARQPSLKLLIYKLTKAAKMFVNSCFIFHLGFFVVRAEMNWLWQEADVCVSAKMLRKSGTGRVSVELQTN